MWKPPPGPPEPSQLSVELFLPDFKPVVRAGHCQPPYKKVTGYKEKVNSKYSVWTARNEFVYERLYLWREHEAMRRGKYYFISIRSNISIVLCLYSFYTYTVDESPVYICPASLLLDAAERLPTTLSALNILISPLPHSMRPNRAAKADNNNNNGSTVDISYEPVDLIAAVVSAVEEWDNFASTHRSEIEAIFNKKQPQK